MYIIYEYCVHDTGRERSRKIKVNQMSGVIQKPAEHDELQTTVAAYFSDTVPSVVNSYAKKHYATTQERITQFFMVG